jgi:hypothetical protein
MFLVDRFETRCECEGFMTKSWWFGVLVFRVCILDLGFRVSDLRIRA